MTLHRTVLTSFRALSKRPCIFINRNSISHTATRPSLKTDVFHLQREVAELEKDLSHLNKRETVLETTKHLPPFTEKDYEDMYNDIKTVVPHDHIKKGQLLLTSSLLLKLRIEVPMEDPSITSLSMIGSSATLRDIVISRTELLLDTSDLSLTIQEVNQVLRMLAKLGRADDITSWIHKLYSRGFQPTIETYDQLIDAYAVSIQPEKALQTFQTLPMAPSVYSFGNLIKAFVRDQQIENAFQIFENMKLKGYQPNLPIFTTLIKGCVQVGQHDRAWKTFDHMRLQVCRPDTIAYSLMIHSCAKTQNVERAIDLYEEMQSHRLTPNKITFNSLINACARREDYFIHAFNILREMQFQGYEPDKYTFNALILACAKHGDISRAKWLLSEMLRLAASDIALKPDTATMTNIFWTFSAWNPKPIPQHKRFNVKADPFQGRRAAASDFDTAAVLDAKPAATSDPATAEEWTFDLATPTRRKAIVRDMDNLFKIIKGGQEALLSEVQLTTFLYNAYLAATIKHQSLEAGLEKYAQISNPNPWTFKILLQACHDQKLEDLAEEIWRAYDASKSNSSEHTGPNPCDNIAKPEEIDYNLRCLMINTLAKCDNVDRAMNFVLDYKPSDKDGRLNFMDVRTLYVKSIQLNRPDVTDELSRVCHGPKAPKRLHIPGTYTISSKNIREKRKKIHRFRD